jgi:hypothetical protein
LLRREFSPHQAKTGLGENPDFARRAAFLARRVGTPGRQPRAFSINQKPTLKITYLLRRALLGILRFRSGFRLAARTPPGQLKMYYFALAFQMEMPYPLAPPQGWEAVLIIENQN